MVMSQEEILLSLVQGDDGQNWASSRIGWKEDSTEKACGWENIECDTHDRVIALLLENTSLSASISPLLAKLTSLKTLELGTNKLYGPLPNELAALPNLVNIDLSNNRLTGTLPTFASPYIRTIDLGHNDFHGSIPSTIVSVYNNRDNILQSLVLSQNRFSGTLPDLSAFSNLVMLDMSSNNLHGEIPPSIGNLHLLKNLYLNNNFLIGPIPPSIATSHPVNGRIADLLEEIHLHDNFLSGTIPVQFADLPRLKKLLLYENKLTGEVPSDICSPDINDHFFQNIDEGQNQNQNQDDVDYCDAISCPTDSVAREGVYPCTACKNPHYNPYIGQMKSCNMFTNQRSILKKFYDSTSQNGKWSGDDGDNWSKDTTFLCDFTGVTCDENFNVIAIHLKNRGLKGTIPDEIGFLKYLEEIDISDNELSGFIPSDFRWAPLKSIDISGNKIRGVVPPKLCLKDGVNGNGLDGDYNCDHITCPVNTYNAIGRRDAITGYPCLPCEHNPFPVVGSTECRQVGLASGIFGIIVVFVTLVLSVSICYIMQYHSRYDSLDPDDKEDDSGQIELGQSANANARRHPTRTDKTKEASKRREQKPRVHSRKSSSNRQPTHDFLDSSSLPYPEAEKSRPNLPKTELERKRSARSTGSGDITTSSTKSSGKYSSGMSVASNKSGKFSIGSGGSVGSDSNYRKDVWLDVPNIT